MNLMIIQCRKTRKKGKENRVAQVVIVTAQVRFPDPPSYVNAVD